MNEGGSEWGCAALIRWLRPGLRRGQRPEQRIEQKGGAGAAGVWWKSRGRKLTGARGVWLGRDLQLGPERGWLGRSLARDCQLGEGLGDPEPALLPVAML